MRHKMFCKVVLKFFVLLCVVITTNVSCRNLIIAAAADDDGGGRMKRSDIDLQTCIDNFNIHKDKIIRTQDSQNMGAKYLNEIDLGSREECLRLCCETDNCDVFVFEEKNAGSCYLFHCGPPEDFKCKFTHHVNYTSGVLAINRHLPDLESQIKLTKHEQDLTKLRKPEVEPAEVAVRTEVKTTPSTTTTTVTTKEILPITKIKSVDEVLATRKCSRFQFECRSTGECIAIYNACDGIPQCADGSDEALELGCPDILTTAPPNLMMHVNPQQPRYEPIIPPSKMNQLPAPPPPQNLYRSPMPPQDTPQLPPVASNPDADFLRPMNDPKSFNPRLQYDPQMASYMPQGAIQGQPNWMPHQSNQMPVQIPQYGDKNSHIFNHKENGLQVPDGQEIRYNKYKGAMQYLHRALGYSGGGKMQYAESVNALRDYPKIPGGGYYTDNTYNNRPSLQQENWPSDDGRYIGNANMNNNNNRYIDKNVQDQINNKASQMQYKSITAGEPVEKFEKVNPKHVQDKMAHDLKHSKENMQHDNADATIKIEKHKIIHREQYPDVVAYKLSDSNDLQDGVAQTPRGAVLSLMLGLIITCIMAILIGCRLKVVRRRMRRGGKSYAHDADYLVNGMYL